MIQTHFVDLNKSDSFGKMPFAADFKTQIQKEVFERVKSAAGAEKGHGQEERKSDKKFGPAVFIFYEVREGHSVLFIGRLRHHPHVHSGGKIRLKFKEVPFQGGNLIR